MPSRRRNAPSSSPPPLPPARAGRGVHRVRRTVSCFSGREGSEIVFHAAHGPTRHVAAVAREQRRRRRRSQVFAERAVAADAVQRVQRQRAHRQLAGGDVLANGKSRGVLVLFSIALRAGRGVWQLFPPARTAIGGLDVFRRDDKSGTDILGRARTRVRRYRPVGRCSRAKTTR